jgi:hypothetical protein
MRIKNCLFILLVLTVSLVSAQGIEDKEVPSAIKNKFNSIYPDAKDVHWGKPTVTNYEAEFDNNGVETSVLFDIKGLIIESQSFMKISDLPKSVTDYITKYYPWKKIKDAVKITETTGKIYYRVGIGVKTTELVFDYQGVFIRVAKSF